MANNISRNFKAAIIDMDGVITQTARLHAKAWKEMFDDFLSKKEGDDFQPLRIEKDYKQYIDGIPRFDGVRAFLKSRNIQIPEGSPEDGPEKDTVYGLGMRKNKIFLELLKVEGVEVYEDTLEVIKKWKLENMKLAVISSSRNCKHIIESSGLSDFFDVRVDGEISQEENLNGKPEPDIFLKASDLLGIDASQAIVLEDAISGVKAGKKGNFALVVGVARSGEENELKKAGADIVVKNLKELEEAMTEIETGNSAENLPYALERIEEIFDKSGSRRPVLFLDYDGTLTPIVSDPDEAILSDKARNVVSKLSKQITVAVISGRDRKDIQSKINLDSLIYAGSHGFDISGPDGMEMQYEPGRKTLPALDEAEKRLNEKLQDVEGAWVERKKFAIAVHYRNVADKKVEVVKNAVLEELEVYRELKKGSGKKILELKPDIDWDKGKALNWLMEELKLDANEYIPIFIGDDITDEDALQAVKDKGIGIMVGSHDQKTAATYRLKNTEEAIEFLDRLQKRLLK
ncbi:trehalose-phosphatase [Marivirga aurantiaca]|nr:trehalose-phosphatase [Marivirga aurantiaca]